MSQDWILLVDPHKNLLNAYRLVLEQEKYLVETALNLEEASHRFSVRRYATLITEYFPPFEEICRIIRRVKENVPETYIIILTSVLIDDATYGKLYEIGVDDLILKPYSPGKILAHIKKGLRQRDLILKKQKLEKQSLVGPVTQKIEQLIFNPTYFRRCFRQELKRAKRHQHSLSVLLVQIPSKEAMENQLENFCLELIKIFRKYVREEDIVGREDDNFAIILPETDRISSQVVVERLSRLIESHPTFQSDTTMKPIARALSFQSFTYPDEFRIPEPLRAVMKEVDKEFQH